MSGKKLLLMTAFVLLLAPTLRAETIIWVGDTDDNDGDGVIDDIGWVEFIPRLGYEIDHRPNYWEGMDDGKVAELNSADLVIISRNTDSGEHQTAGPFWNSVTTPMIMMTPYLPRNNRWDWISSNDLQRNPGAPVWQAIDGSHRVFDGVTLDANGEVLPFDERVGTGNTAHLDTLDLGSGVVIAQVPGTEMTGVVEWTPGAAFYPGGPMVEGPRLLFTAGTSEDGGPQGALNLTPEGELLFVNAIDYMLGAPLRTKAFLPQPVDGDQDAAQELTLTWKAGLKAVSHNVYFSANFDDVNDSTEAALIGSGLTETSLAIADTLEMGRTYYWRVDEVNEADAESPWTGDVWSFTVRNYVVIDDFEAYDDDTFAIYDAWLDGFVNGTTSTVGNLSPPYAEQTVVHSGYQSMPFTYDNFTTPYYAEAQLPFDSPRDFSGGQALAMWVRGSEDNAPAPLYAGVNEAAVTHSDAAIIQVEQWQRWDVPMSALSAAGADLTAVSQVILGVGNRDNPVAGFGGILYVDDVRLELQDPQ